MPARINAPSMEPSAQEAAQGAIAQTEVLNLSMADQECLAQALLSPPKPAPALERAFHRRKRFARAWDAIEDAPDKAGNMTPGHTATTR